MNILINYLYRESEKLYEFKADFGARFQIYPLEEIVILNIGLRIEFGGMGLIEKT